MNLLEPGKSARPHDFGVQQIAKTKGSYDKLAGSALLRRAGRAAGATAPLRGDQAATLLASRDRKAAADQVGRQLSDFYEAILRQPVPDRILALVDALEAKQAG
jgi:hypothetical protein